jgi:hypothetical protein
MFSAKPCTYLAPILRLSPNRPKWDSTWPRSPRCSIGSVQSDFWAYGTFNANLHISCVKNSTISKRTETSIHLSLVAYKYHLVRSKWFLRLWYVWRKPCTYLAPILTLSLNGPKWDFTWPTSPRCSIGCIQNDFWAYGMFSAKPCTNLAPILRLSKRTEMRFHMTHVT